MKQVLVIDKDTVEEYVTKFSVDDIERDAIEHFIKHHNPGNLLAEVSGTMVTGDGDKPYRLFLPKESEIRGGEDVTLLILTCADEGSASDEGSEGK